MTGHGAGSGQELIKLKAAAEYAHGRLDGAAALDAVEAVTGGNSASIVRGSGLAR